MRIADKLVVLILLVWVGLTGCDSAALVEFEHPQPYGKREEKSFHRRFQGEYVNQEGDTKLVITDRTVTREFQVNYRTTRAEIDTLPEFRLENGVLYGREGEKYSFTQEGDSLFIDLRFPVDTLFELSSGQVLKYFKGNYFLNQRTESGKWQTQRIGFDEKGRLEIGEITDSIQIQQLREVTTITATFTNDKTQTTFSANPTRKEFKKFLQEGGLDGNEKFFKVKP